MLVLSRKKNESVVITVPPSSTPTTITLTTIETRGDKTRTGFDAPKEVTVHRKEVQDAIERNR